MQFIAIQAKSAPKFQAADIGTFIAGVRMFFERDEPVGANKRVLELYRLKEYIFDCSIDMDRSPVCRLYFASTGSWKSEIAASARANQGLSDLQNTGLFSTVEFTPIDSDDLQRVYRELHNKIIREIKFEKHTILPQISGVPEAYIGIVPAQEYLRLICDEDGILNRRLFYDNVRDFQGNNPVNQEIEATIVNAEHSDRFSLLNNGVTIVAREINKVGANFKIQDFQIVNGCQTSHILYRNRERLTPDVQVPLKLIVTTDSEVTNRIIQGTNRQTEVKLEAFESLAPFQKKLEELYNAVSRERSSPLYYERRSKQYDEQGINKSDIITLPAQINCYVAMFLNEPHSTHRYYGELLLSYRNRIFHESHSPLPYFVSGAALATIERLSSQGVVGRMARRLKYQALMVFRLQNEKGELPPLNSKAVETYCQNLLEVLDDKVAAEKAFAAAGRLVEAVGRRLDHLSREPVERTRAFTNALVEESSQGGGTSVADVTYSSGIVNWFSDVRGYGFIDVDDGSTAFVHFTAIAWPGYRSLFPGQRVRFILVDSPRGPVATSVGLEDEAES